MSGEAPSLSQTRSLPLSDTEFTFIAFHALITSLVPRLFGTFASGFFCDCLLGVGLLHGG